jgi:thiamine-phosphate pyrophosphorylase
MSFVRRPLARLCTRLKPDLSLMQITGPCRDEQELLWRVTRAGQGGATSCQIRDADLQRNLRLGDQLVEIGRQQGVSMIFNNHWQAARRFKVGLHIGQSDIAYQKARRLLGQDSLIGLTVLTRADVIAAEALCVDYLGVQVFRSKNTKPERAQVWGLEGLKWVREHSSKRLVVLGGIDKSNAKQVCEHLWMGPQGDGIAMVGELWRAADPYPVAKEMREIIDAAKVAL